MTRRTADRKNGIAQRIRNAVRELLELARGACWQIMGGVPLRYDEDVRDALSNDRAKDALGCCGDRCGKGCDG